MELNIPTEKTAEKFREKSQQILHGINEAIVNLSVKSLITSPEVAKNNSSCIGSKALNAFALEKISEIAKIFKTPVSCCLPYGALGSVFKCEEGTKSIPFMPPLQNLIWQKGVLK